MKYILYGVAVLFSATFLGTVHTAAAFEGFHLTPQDVVFDPLPVVTYGDPPFVPYATSSSGIPLFIFTNGTACISDFDAHTVVILSAGTCTLTAFNTGSGFYLPVTPIVKTLTVLQKGVTVAFTANNKTYDGTADATIATSSIVDGLVGMDVATTSGGVAVFADALPGVGKAVTATGFTLGGTSASNYVVATITPAVADITGQVPVPPTTGGGGGGVISGPLSVGYQTGGEVLGAETEKTAPKTVITGDKTTPTPGCSALITSIPLSVNHPNNSTQNAQLPLDGVFGSSTEAAVEAFQLTYWQDILAPWVAFSLPTDHSATGVVSITTSWKINMLVCPALNLPKPVLQ
jgi:peptidoglycan hydrolase-like protein with peptidoglycan-binding domain